MWSPSPDFIAATNVWRFMQRLGFHDREAFLRFSREDPERFWDELVREMRVEWFAPYHRVLDASRGPEWTQWFTGGTLNIAHNCLDRWADTERVACIWEARERRDPAGHLPRSPDASQSRRQRTARARASSPAIAWRSACRWSRKSSRFSTAASRRGSPWCRSSQASARARSPRAWRIPARACCSRRSTWSAAANCFRWRRRCRRSAGTRSCSDTPRWDEFLAAQSAEARHAVARFRSPRVHSLHLGHHRQAQGHGPHARRMPGADGQGDLARLRPPRRRPASSGSATSAG